MSDGAAIVRLARPGDREAIVAAIATMGGHDDVGERADPLTTFQALLAAPGARALVAERDGAVVGVAAFEARTSLLTDRREAWLGVLAVAPGMRSQRIGTALLAAVEREAARLGCAAVVLESSQTRERAQSFYLDRGYVEAAPARRFARELRPSMAALPERFLALAARAASAVAVAVAGRAALAAVGIGADGAPTEAADEAAERAACAELAPLGLPIVSEESGTIGGPVDPASQWISLDPLDGSRNFVAGYPAYATSIALVAAGRPLAGLVVDLVSGSRWAAVAGEGATRDGVHVTTRRSGLAAVPSGLPGDPCTRTFPGIARVRMSGSTTRDLCGVADGSLAAFYGLDRPVVHVHDLAAAMLVVEEAGGCVVDRRGRVPTLVPDVAACLDVVAACDRATAEALLAL